MWVVLICIGLVVGDGNERKQKGHSGQMSGGGTAESYVGFGCESAFWGKEKAILGLAGKASLKGKVLRFLFCFVFFEIVLMWKIVGALEVSVIYIYIYI